MKCFVIAIMDKSTINLLFINLYHIINKFMKKIFRISEDQKLYYTYFNENYYLFTFSYIII